MNESYYFTSFNKKRKPKHNRYPSFTDEQSIVMADITANQKLLFTPEYSNWRHYIMNNSPEYLNRLWISLSKSDKDDIYENNFKAFTSLSNNAKSEYMSSRIRNKTNKISPYVVGGLVATAAAPFIADVADPAIGNAATRAFESTIGSATDAFAESSLGQKAIPFFNNYIKTPLNATLAADGIKEFAVSNGFQKKYNHFANGEYGEGIMSGVGDAVNLGLTALGGGELMDIGRGVVNGVRGTATRGANYL